MKITNDEGVEVEVFTADEVKTQVTAAETAKENEYKPKLTAAEAETQRLDGLLKARGEEFKQFRKLSDEQVSKLSIAEKTIYDNGLLLQEERDKNAARDKESHDNLVLATIKGKVGTDEKLITKVKDMYALIGIEARTPEEIERKTAMVLGAISTTEPDLLAGVAGFSGGSFEPPKKKTQKEGESFADTDAGKAFGAELGLTLEVPKK